MAERAAEYPVGGVGRFSPGLEEIEANLEGLGEGVRTAIYKSRKVKMGVQILPAKWPRNYSSPSSRRLMLVQMLGFRPVYEDWEYQGELLRMGCVGATGGCELGHGRRREGGVRILE